MELEEIWKDIIGFEGFYKVSNLGNVKSLERIIKRKLKGNLLVKEKLLKIRLSKDGYRLAWLCKDGKEYNKKVNRLVAIAFLENKDNKPQVNHIDGIKTNDNLSNLEWVTASENEKHAHRIGLKNYKLENSPSTKLKNKDVLEIRKMWESGLYNQTTIGNKFNITPSAVSRIVNYHNFKEL